MAIVGCQEIWNGRTGGIDDKGVRHYTRVFLVEVNSLQDDALIVTGTASCIPALYSSYIVVTSSDLGAILKNTTAKQDVQNPYLWTVTCEYDSGPLKTMEHPSSSNDNRVTPPDNRPWTFSFSSNKTDKLLIKDWTAYNNQSDPTALPKALVNSAGQPFDPPIVTKSSNPVIKITAFKSNFNFQQINTYQDAVNNAMWQGFNAHSVLCTDYSATSHFDNGVFCFQIDLQVEIKWDNWNPFLILDAGCYEIKDTLAGPKVYRQITDAYGQPTHSPVPLNGNGGKLQPGQPLQYLSFQAYREENFANII